MKNYCSIHLYVIAGNNFGCGSSREHAPWALFDFGIKCIIAPSFADIFYNNCFKNGILPLALSNNDVEELMGLAKDPENQINIDLPKQEVRAGNKIYKSPIPDRRCGKVLSQLGPYLLQYIEI